MIRPQYHFRSGSQGLKAWNVARLIRASRALPIIEVSLNDLSALDEPYWGRTPMTVRDVATHAGLMLAADTGFPILLCAEGRIMDGMHRVARAHLDGQSAIAARRFPVTPRPDYENAVPDQLSYDSKDFQI